MPIWRHDTQLGIPSPFKTDILNVVETQHSRKFLSAGAFLFLHLESFSNIWVLSRYCGGVFGREISEGILHTPV